MNMKKINITLLVAALLIMGSCGEDFLVKKPSQQFASETISNAAKTDPSLLASSVAGLAASMYADGSGGTGTGTIALRHDDYGQKGYDVYSDMLSSDMLLGALTYGWYGPVARYQATKDFTRAEDNLPWTYYYKLIFGANTIIDGLGGTDAVLPNVTTLDKSKRVIMGQAKAQRAHSYFYLAQFYGPGGYGDGSQKILPIYTKVQDNQPLSTAQDVYNLMVSDLTTAIDYLNGYVRSGPEEINQWVAKGILAYVLAARGSSADLQQVVTLTNDIITNGGYPMASPNALVAKFAPATGNPTADDARPILNLGVAGFNNVNTSPNWMWGVDLTLNSNLDLVSWYGQMDLFTYSYAWAGDPKVIDDGLYSLIRSDDIRKQQFTYLSWDDSHRWPINKFFSSVRTKFDDANEEGGQRYIIDDYVYMRVEEFYLLNAEANAKLGQDGDAKAILKTLLQPRITNIAYIDLLSGQTLQDEIYLQTRIELWGEGKSFLALKRNKATCKRGSTDLFYPGQSFTFDSDELTFPIPQQEVLNNAVLNK